MAVRMIKLYAVEDSVDASETYSAFQDVQDFINFVTNSRWWKKRSTIQHVEAHISAKPELGAIKCYWRKGEVLIWRPLSRLMLCHELAHLLIWKNNRSDHRSEFITAYLEMATKFVGKKQANRLATALLLNKVHGAKKGVADWLDK